jgi:hypothetical protein
VTAKMMTPTATPPRCPQNPTTVKLGVFLVFCIFISFTKFWQKKLTVLFLNKKIKKSLNLNY